ncbi:alkaline phosphatase D family protein [Kordiimonas sp. A6E486]|nr:alkaline phosphatase D family protein [Kordiimonas marina]
MSMGPSRRAVVSGMGATLGLLALRGHKVLADAPAHFTHGIASGDPLADRVILWTRVLPGSGKQEAISVRWQVAHDTDFNKIISSGMTDTGPGRDYTVKVDAGGLKPGHTYYYRFSAGGVTSPVGRTRTLPKDGIERLKLAVISCSNYPQGYFNVYRELAGRDVEAILHLGDYIYEYPVGYYDNKEAVEMGRHIQPKTELLKLEDYRMRYGLYRTDPDLQAAHAAHPFICVWDDHEVANDTWKNGAQNHNPGEGDFAVRKAAAIKAYREWIPVRDNVPAEPEKIYRTFDYGGLASLIMLDTRLIARDKQLNYAHDLPMQTIAFDMTDPDAPKAVLDEAAVKALPADKVKHVAVPFNLDGKKPEPMTDWNTIKSLDPKKLPKGYSYLPDAETFKTKLLGDPKRTMMGEAQEAWFADELKRSTQAGTPWQVIGQQVIIGKIGIPSIPEDKIDFSEAHYLTREKYRAYQMLAALGLPFNLDSWDGYPACRNRVLDSVQKYSKSTVFLSGDSHNAWAFNLADRHGKPAAVEFATSAVSSPGLEDYLRADAKLTADSFLKASPEMKYVDTTHRGWLELDITPTRMKCRYLYVDTVLSKDYKVIEGPIGVTDAGSQTLSVGEA